MKRGALSALLVACTLGLGLTTLLFCTHNRARAAHLDAVHHSCRDLSLRNAQSRAKVFGHRPGELKLEDTDPQLFKVMH